VPLVLFPRLCCPQVYSTTSFLANINVMMAV
jgi:hypothetical protein